MSFLGFHRLEANFTPTPNQFFDEVIRGDYPKCVIVVVAVLIRETLGWQDRVTGERRIEAELALSQITQKSGLSVNSARQGIREAIAAGFVIETASHDNRHGARYALRWADMERQKEAITRTRLATRDRLAEEEPALQVVLERDEESGGANFGGPKNGAPNSGDPKFAPTKRKRFSEKKEIESKEKKALNVSDDGGQAPEPDQRATPNEGIRGINAVGERAVQEVVTLTRDEGSQRRFWQLWEIAEGRNALDAWRAALNATRRRLKSTTQKPLERPGAYFDSICIKELEKREIFVPTNAERHAEPNVAEMIRGELAAENSETKAPSHDDEAVPVLPRRFVSERSTELVDAQTPECLDAELADLERECGDALQLFQSYVAERRERYQAELSGMGATARERLMSAFDRPEKRRELFRQWKNI